MTTVAATAPTQAKASWLSAAADGSTALNTAEGWRRVLQLCLAIVWMFDAVLQFQPFMFTRDFGSSMLAPVAVDNPGPVAHSIMWTSSFISAHAQVCNAGFAFIQLAIAVAIAWRPLTRFGLALSIPWSLAVWWLGEGFGGVLSGQANPITGAPGAVIIYAVLAVLLWPRETERDGERCVAEQSVGTAIARMAWVVFWAGMAILAVYPANRRPGSVTTALVMTSRSAPAWLASVQQSIASGLDGDGRAVALALAAVFLVVAITVFLPARVAKALLVFTGLLALSIWVVGEGFGGVLTAPQTDPNSGPLLLLLAAAYWPLARPVGEASSR
jgi:hypothetical protein